MHIWQEGRIIGIIGIIGMIGMIGGLRHIKTSHKATKAKFQFNILLTQRGYILL